MPGKVCAHGSCCNIGTGQFKGPGSLCRDAMLECDLPDYCSGSSAACESDLFKPDGTDCANEGGEDAHCYQGACKGLDTQCDSAFKGYDGEWIADARRYNGAQCQQGGSGCGLLKCTQIGWPANAMCIGMSSDFIPGYVLPPILVDDGTPCQHDTGQHLGICSNGQCGAMTIVAPPPPPPFQPPPPPPPPPLPAAVHCTGEWQAFSPCSQPCGNGGSQSRTYQVTRQESNGGEACPFEDGQVQTQGCNQYTCPTSIPPPVDCKGDLTDPSPCSSSCGGGHTTYTFAVSQPAMYGGLECQHEHGDEVQAAQQCNTQACEPPAPPASSTCDPADENTCDGRGRCGVEGDGFFSCRCFPGWVGVRCSQPTPCAPNCAGLHRQPCVVEDACGACLPDWNHLGDELSADSACTMQTVLANGTHVNVPPHPIRRPQDSSGNRRRRLQTHSVEWDPRRALDGSIDTHWQAEFERDEQITSRPTLNVEFDSAKQVTHYTITSSISDPAKDPGSWVVYCRLHDEPDADWQLVDTKTHELFSGRHQTRMFQMTPEGNIYPLCDELSFVIVDVNDAEYQGGAGMAMGGEVILIPLYVISDSPYETNRGARENDCMTLGYRRHRPERCGDHRPGGPDVHAEHALVGGEALHGDVRAEPAVLHCGPE